MAVAECVLFHCTNSQKTNQIKRDQIYACALLCSAHMNYSSDPNWSNANQSSINQVPNFLLNDSFVSSALSIEQQTTVLPLNIFMYVIKCMKIKKRTEMPSTTKKQKPCSEKIDENSCEIYWIALTKKEKKRKTLIYHKEYRCSLQFTRKIRIVCDRKIFVRKLREFQIPNNKHWIFIFWIYSILIRFIYLHL